MRIKCARDALDSVYEKKYSVRKNGVIMGRLIKKIGYIYYKNAPNMQDMPIRGYKYYNIGVTL